MDLGTDKESTTSLMVMSTKVLGRLIKKMVMASSEWTPETFTKGTGKMVKNTVSENIHLQMEIIMKVNLWKVCVLVEEYINGLMAVTIKVNGKLTK